MIFRVIEVDDGSHWHMMAWSPWKPDREFGEWITQHYPNISAVNRFNNGNPYWILKGDNPRDQTLILMKWQNSEER
jgi:hypothetical protein